MSTHDSADRPVEQAWRSRWIAAAAVRTLAVGGPIVLGTATGRLVAQAFSPGSSAWLVGTVSLLSAVLVSVATARIGARLLPLAVLLKMTMLFPDQAPNRVKVARRATSKDELSRRLADPDASARETATTLLALVTALGRHDRKTRGHSERVRLYCELVGVELGLNDSDRGRLRWVGLLHDIGKLEVAAAVLNKPGKLDESEWEAVRAHPDNGATLARPLAEWLGPWYDGIRQHHERFDGTGYPLGLSGDQISLSGRAVSVVDAFEAMTASRSYKSPMSTVAARAELTGCAGSHFDPVVVRAFLAIALPRLLWTMGPLTFLVNIPFLRWIPASSVRAADLAAAGASTATGAVGITAVTVVVAASQSPSISHSHSHSHDRAAFSVAALSSTQTAPPAGQVAGTQNAPAAVGQAGAAGGGNLAAAAPAVGSGPTSTVPAPQPNAAPALVAQPSSSPSSDSAPGHPGTSATSVSAPGASTTASEPPTTAQPAGDTSAKPPKSSDKAKSAPPANKDDQSKKGDQLKNDGHSNKDDQAKNDPPAKKDAPEHKPKH